MRYTTCTHSAHIEFREAQSQNFEASFLKTSKIWTCKKQFWANDLPLTLYTGKDRSVTITILLLWKKVSAFKIRV